LDGGVEDGLAGGGGMDGPGDLVASGVFGEVAEGAGAQGGDDRLVVGVEDVPLGVELG
jgi:hypothetical protein